MAVSKRNKKIIILADYRRKPAPYSVDTTPVFPQPGQPGYMGTYTPPAPYGKGTAKKLWPKKDPNDGCKFWEKRKGTVAAQWLKVEEMLGALETHKLLILLVVRERGLEPLRDIPLDPKSSASTSSATLAQTKSLNNFPSMSTFLNATLCYRFWIVFLLRFL